MKTFAITYISEKTSGVEVITVQNETVDLALQGFREGRVVGIVEIESSGKNL
jgi:hypothetical protein